MKDIDFYKRLSDRLLNCEDIECIECEFEGNKGGFYCDVYKISAESISDLIKEINKLNEEIKDREECSIEQHNEIHYWIDRARKVERKLEWIKESLKVVGDSDYYNYFNEWEVQAENNGYKEEWLAKIGEWVKLYCLDCDSKEEEPTFDGLFMYIKNLYDEEDVF